MYEDEKKKKKERKKRKKRKKERKKKLPVVPTAPRIQAKSQGPSHTMAQSCLKPRGRVGFRVGLT